MAPRVGIVTIIGTVLWASWQVYVVSAGGSDSHFMSYSSLQSFLQVRNRDSELPAVALILPHIGSPLQYSSYSDKFESIIRRQRNLGAVFEAGIIANGALDDTDSNAQVSSSISSISDMSTICGHDRHICQSEVPVLVSFSNISHSTAVEKLFEHTTDEQMQDTVGRAASFGSAREMEVFVRFSVPTVCAVIPARFASTRFPGKMLSDIHGKPMIQRTFDRVRAASSVDRVWVTSESPVLLKSAKRFTHNVLESSDRPRNGMERLGEIESRLAPSCSIVVNVHGDEPALHPGHVDQVVSLLLDKPPDGRIVGATLRSRLPNEERATSLATVKLVLNPVDETILYLSRALIPGSKSGRFDPQFTYWSHINLHAFKRGFPSDFAAHPTTPAQGQEDVEYNKILEMGFTLRTTEIGEVERDVNGPEDLQQLLEKFPDAWPDPSINSSGHAE